MKLTLFLGSGVSIPSGYPDVKELTDRILNPPDYTLETIFLNALKDFNDLYCLKGGIAKLYPQVNIYHSNGKIYNRGTSYEDLFHLCEQIRFVTYGWHDNSMAAAFAVSFINDENFCARISVGNNEKEKLYNIGPLARGAYDYINEKIPIYLKSSEETKGSDVIIKGLDLINELAKDNRVDYLNILTLNHDILVEKFLLKNTIYFADGFGIEDGNVRWFDPDTFADDKVKIKLIKLHGSIDWYDTGSKVVKVIQDTSNSYKNAKGEIIKPVFKSPNFLMGANKEQKYTGSIYTDIHYHFQKTLYESNTILMSGYGWGDEGINNRLMTWLDKPNHKLILLHENDIKELKDTIMMMQRDYDGMVRNGKLRVIKQWLCDVSLEDVMNACK